MNTIIKKSVTVLATLALYLLPALAQSPEKISYQAVIRNTEGVLVANQQVRMQISILKNSANGNAVYSETHTPTTNANGLVSVEIGTGTLLSGNFTTIDWANGPYFIKTETDPAGGTSYSIISTSQLLSVPYALHAKTAETITGEITESQISDLGNYIETETDPVFTEWDKSTGISITESQISDLGDYIEAETDPVFTEWDKSTGISITISQISDLDSLEITETDPAVSANFDFTGAVVGDILQFNGTKWVRATPDNLITYEETQSLADVIAIGADANNQNITNLANPINAQDAATKAYVDHLISLFHSNINAVNFYANNSYYSNIHTIIGDSVFFTSYPSSLFEVSEWFWDFGDGTTSTEQHPTHIYTVPGIYTVSLTASDGVFSITKTINNYITVERFSVDFSASNENILVGESVSFFDNSSSSVNNWLWDFGDGATSTEQNPTHIYTTAGVVYSVSLTAGDSVETKTKRKSIFVVTELFVDFSANNTNIVLGDSVVFTSVLNFVASEWLWDFGDGTTSTEQHPTHIYTAPGIYTVRLTAAGNSVADATKTKTDYITVEELSVDFSANNTNIVLGDSVIFTSVSNFGACEWLWDFGDGATSTEQHPTHIYTVPGIYTVSLSADNGVADTTITKTDYITVNVNVNDSLFTDSRDGNVYQIVAIGSQIWMAENLKYLPNVVGYDTTSNTIPYYYVYGYNGTDVAAAKTTENYATYGVLYNWTAAMNGAASSNANPSGVQGICPTGWHLPSAAEWDQLINYLGGENVAGGKLKEAGTEHWWEPNRGATNETGFTALPGGSLDYIYGGYFFTFIENSGFWWSASGYRLWMSYNSSYVHGPYSSSNMSVGFSVRCVKD
ncbi:MAG TPA: PKD domain-containing protein [Salinivirgaceae bacterium]|nr:PKD domain-containing protein [Salinivirgaceae bacterium]